MHIFIKIGFSTLYLFLFSGYYLIAQSSGTFNKQISIAHENDGLAFRGTDGYYTSGIFINYSTLGKIKNAGINKIINEYEIGQKIYTPGIREVFVIKELDRPITGYLYGSYNQTRFFKGNTFLKLGISAGTVGPAALGKEVLDLFHPLIKINSEFWAWMFEYKLKNELGINLNGSYAFSILEPQNAGIFQITPVSSLTLGTTFTNIKQSVLFQIGKHNTMVESSFWNARLYNDNSKPNDKPEYFLYYQPELTYQLYNATVQGGLFRNDKGKLVSQNKSIVLLHKIGATLARSRYSVGVSINFPGKEAKLQRTSHAYGGFQLGYRFN